MEVTLKTFIAETIKEIIDGIATAAEDIVKTYNKTDSPNIEITTSGYQRIEFDISIASSQSGETSGNAGVSIKVLDIGGKKSSIQEQSAINKIKFSVFVSVQGRNNYPH